MTDPTRIAIVDHPLVNVQRLSDALEAINHSAIIEQSDTHDLDEIVHQTPFNVVISFAAGAQQTTIVESRPSNSDDNSIARCSCAPKSEATHAGALDPIEISAQSFDYPTLALAICTIALRSKLRELEKHCRQSNVAAQQKRHPFRGATNGVIRMLAHDIRTPLSVIHQYSAIMRGGLLGDINLEQEESLETITLRADALNRLITDLVDFETLDRGALVLRRQPVSVEELLAEKIDEIRAELSQKDFDLKVHFESGIPAVYCDVSRTQNAIRTFLLSLTKFSAPSKTIELEISFDRSTMSALFTATCHAPQFSASRVKDINAALQPDAENPDLVGETLGLSALIARRFCLINLATIALELTDQDSVRFSMGVPLFNVDSLLEKYGRRAKNFDRDIIYVGLSVITFNDNNVEACSYFDDVLHATIRSTDLLFRKDTGTWLLVQPRDQVSCINIIDRLGERMSQLSPALAPSSQPICVNQIGLWNWDTEYERFKSVFKNTYYSIATADYKSPVRAPQSRREII